MEIRLLVVRTGDIKRLANFYSALGFSFNYHQHGNSPLHYSTTIGLTVLEIYPLSKDQFEPDKHLRLGFTIDHFEETVQQLKAMQVVFPMEPAQTEFGYMAITTDPDGRKIELYKK